MNRSMLVQMELPSPAVVFLVSIILFEAHDVICALILLETSALYKSFTYLLCNLKMLFCNIRTTEVAHKVDAVCM